MKSDNKDNKDNKDDQEIDTIIHVPKNNRFPVDIYEWRGQYVIAIEAPGLIDETMSYKSNDNIFTFSAKLEEIPGGSFIHLNERQVYYYRRSFVIPLGYNINEYDLYNRNGLVIFQFKKTIE